MRTTVNLEPDVEAAVSRLREEQGLGLSEAVNVLARQGAARQRPATSTPFRQPTRNLGLIRDVSNVAEVLELMESDG